MICGEYYKLSQNYSRYLHTRKPIAKAFVPGIRQAAQWHNSNRTDFNSGWMSSLLLSETYYLLSFQWDEQNQSVFRKAVFMSPLCLYQLRTSLPSGKKSIRKHYSCWKNIFKKTFRSHDKLNYSIVERYFGIWQHTGENLISILQSSDCVFAMLCRFWNTML